MSPLLVPRKFLLPLVPLYRAGLWLREKRLGGTSDPIRRLRYPIISIGNLSTGGAGKTPLTIALARALSRRGLQVDVLSRGFGRKNTTPARVSSDGTAAEFGDEPILIAQQAAVPVYVAPLRFDAGQISERERAMEIAVLGQTPKPLVHLLDDGFQHRQLHRDIDILLLNRQDWEDSLLPAGNLRESRTAARRATILAIPAEDANLASELRAWGWQGPVWRMRRSLLPPAIDGPVAAFCGIARPRQFFAGLEQAGLQLAVRTAFADHHPYTARDVDRIGRAASAAGATALLTTEKDLVRLGALASAIPANLPLKAVPLQVSIEDETQAIQALLDPLKLKGTQPSL